MAVYTKVKACCLDGEVWSYIKAYNVQKYVQQETANLREHYEGAVEFNKHVTWATVNIDNAHFMSEHK